MPWSSMYLKSLELAGFKSFSEKVILSFSGPQAGAQSITAIVGPNGAGKSNVADAIRWVLGEQSLRLMRGKKSEDFIFSGSESKGKMGVASVTLTIDNQDGRLPIEYEELVVTRRIYRTGEGEYLVNGHAVRLLDLQLLLAKGQFGQGSYSVIGQGMIDHLLLQTSAERKDFFDEAFGIKEFQLKRHQAVLKLARTKENLAQAEALLAEVSPRLKSLSRQVKKLEERQEIETGLRTAQEQYYATLWQRHEAQLNEWGSELLIMESDYRSGQARLTSIHNELSSLAKESSPHEIYTALQASYQAVAQEKISLERERAVFQGRLQVEYSKVGWHNVGWLENKISALKGEQQKWQHQMDEAGRLIGELSTAVADRQKRLVEMTTARTELRVRLDALESQLVQAKSEQNLLQFTGQKAVQAILAERDRFGRVFGAVAQLAEVDEPYQLAMDVAAGGHLSALVVADDRVAEAAIRYLRAEQLGVATFLPLNKIKPRLAAPDIQAGLCYKGVHGLATDLARFDERFANIFSFVFGNTLIVDDIEAARAIGIGRVRMVTLHGDLLETSGSMKGGQRRERWSGLSFVRRQAPYLLAEEVLGHTDKIETVKQELDRAERSYEEALEVRCEVQAQLEVEGKKQQLVSAQKQALDRELAALEQERSLTTMSATEYSSAMKAAARAASSQDKRIMVLEKSLADRQKEITQFHQEEERKKQRIFFLQDESRGAQTSLNQLAEKRNEKQIVLAKLETKHEDLAGEAYQELRVSIESLVRREVETVEFASLVGVQANIQKLKYKLTLIGGIDQEVRAEYEETHTRHDRLLNQLADLHKAWQDLEKLVVELDELMKQRRAQAFKEIQKGFQRYFKILFEGGKAGLLEVYGDEEASFQTRPTDFVSAAEADEALGPGGKRKKNILLGVEITACPPGKKIQQLAALSGGERTLTAIALICAILHTNPPPFVVLDEVEAALDESNTLRFTAILKELAKQSQFILITHNRATMHAADALYGVTMGGDGVSHLLSVKLGEVKKETKKAIDLTI